MDSALKLHVWLWFYILSSCMNSEKHYRIKLWQEKDLCAEQVIKGRKVTEPLGALLKIVFLE